MGHTRAEVVVYFAMPGRGTGPGWEHLHGPFEEGVCRWLAEEGPRSSEPPPGGLPHCCLRACLPMCGDACFLQETSGRIRVRHDLPRKWNGKVAASVHEAVLRPALVKHRGPKPMS